MSKLSAIIVFFVLSCSVGFASGGSVAGTGGSTEITQVANNAQLAKTVAQNAQQLSVQITTATNTVNTYMTALENLRHLPAAAIAKLLKPYKDQIKSYASLYKAVSGVYKTATDLNTSIEDRKREMVNLKTNPRAYIEAEIAYAQAHGDGAGKRIEEDLKKLGLFEAKAKELEEVQKSIPTSVTGNLSGLQTLNQQVAAMRAENMEMRAAIIEQKLLAEQQHQDASRKQKNVGEARVADLKEQDRRASDAKRDNALYTHPEFGFVW